MEEVQEDIYIGIGIKRMKGYRCNLKVDELNKLREHFWEVKTNSKNNNWLVWNTIKRAVSFDELRASLLLEEYGIKTVDGCINNLIDSKGNHYKIPNYCINEPYTYDLPESHLKRPEKKKIAFHGRRGGEQFKIKTENYTKIESIRKNIGKKFQKDVHCVRLFFRGKEMKDGNELWQYNVQDEDVIIIMCSG